MWTARTIDEMRKRRGDLVGRVAFVPTMGALHRGHVSLIDAARKFGDHVVVSIFVNPAQFGPKEDFSRYPRPIEKDLAMCEAAGAAGVFNPEPAEMYPPLTSGVLPCDVTIPALASILEGASRPGHFAGVCRVVAKLFNIVQPHVACFGQKDYQQVRVINAMVDDLNIPVRIAELATVREPDGLAMSSRNVYLDAESRKRAVGLSLALAEAAAMIEQRGETDSAAVESTMRQIIAAHHLEPDYHTVRHPHTLQPLDLIDPKQTGGVVALVAARIGGVRLIDNRVIGAAAR